MSGAHCVFYFRLKINYSWTGNFAVHWYNGPATLYIATTTKINKMQLFANNLCSPTTFYSLFPSHCSDIPYIIMCFTKWRASLILACEGLSLAFPHQPNNHLLTTNLFTWGMLQTGDNGAFHNISSPVCCCCPNKSIYKKISWRGKTLYCKLTIY